MEFETLFDRLSLPPLRSSVFPPPSVWSSTSTAQAGFGPCRQRLRGPNGPRASRVRRQAAPAWAIERAALVHAHNPAARPLRQPRLARQRGRPALLGQAGAADRSRPALRALESATWLMGELYRAAGFEGVAKHVEYVLATQPAESRPLFVRALRRNVPGRGGDVMNYRLVRHRVHAHSVVVRAQLYRGQRSRLGAGARRRQRAHLCCHAKASDPISCCPSPLSSTCQSPRSRRRPSVP